MFEIINRTPFVVSLIPGLGKDDVAHMTVLAKGTFSIPIPPGPPRIAEQQIPFWPGDEWNGPEPATSSVRFESDACPTKPGTDVVLVGHAYAGARRQATVDVGLRVGKLQKVVRVTGDRIWTRAAFAWVMSSPPVAFERLPLVYERAFGGVDRSDPAQPAGDDRNPVGTGFDAAARKERLEGLRLPNLEDPRHLIRKWNDRPPVAGFGVISRGWLPRRSLGGTYDQRWTEQRNPLLPEDFDPRFFNGAPADQVAVPHLRGGEPVSLSNCSPDGVLAFELPRIALSITIDWAAGPQAQEVPPVLDTVILDPDERRIVMSWRSTFPCGRRLRQVQRVVVRMARGA
jgi:hypothetical protein